MTHAVILRSRAEEDIRVAVRWYESQQPTLGEDFLLQLRRTLERVAEFPATFPLVHKTVRRALMAKYPYLAFYVVEPARVVVLAVLHTSRNPVAWPRQ
jgi:plasmid stabilization system protein ParE